MAKAAKIANLNAQMLAVTALQEILVVRVSELWAWGELIRDHESADELHDMRIAAKRLRYCLEFFSPLLGETAVPVLAQFKQLQDLLGEIHDCDVWTVRLKKLRRKEIKTTDGARDLVTETSELVSELAERRTKMFFDFLSYWDKLNQGEFKTQLLAMANHAKGIGGESDS